MLWAVSVLAALVKNYPYFRSQHSNHGGARGHSRASVAQMLAAASVKVMDALFAFVARKDAEWSR